MFCRKKLVMWKLININTFSYFPVCYECANNIKLKLETFDTTKVPVKIDVLKRAQIVMSKKANSPYGIPD